MNQGLRSILGPSTGGVITTEEKDGTVNLYQIGVLERLQIRLRNPETNEVVNIRHALMGVHRQSLYKEWNSSFMPELTGSLATFQFSHVPMMAPQMLHLVELGMYLGFRLQKLITNKDLQLDVKREFISANQMDAVLEAQRQRATNNEDHE